MNKRGDSQIDWVISLGIFLLYLAWFFIFIRPYMIQEGKPNLVEIVSQNFDNEAYWSVQKLPIIITSGGIFSKVPIIVNIPPEYNESNSYMNNQAFMIDNSRLFFIASLNFSDVFYLTHSNSSYIMYNQITDLAASQQSAKVTDFEADFENETLTSAFYFGTRIISFLQQVGSQMVDTANSSFSDKKIAARYSVTSQAANITTYVFAYNPAIYMSYETNKSIYQRFELDKYDNYFFDNSNNGNVHYPVACYSKNAKQLVLYDNVSNVLFDFDREVSFNFCSQRDEIMLEISFDGSAEERIIFFRRDFRNYADYIDAYDAQAGIVEETSALSLANLKLLNVSNYNDLKYRWNSPDFRIFVINSSDDSMIAVIGSTPYEKATVYAKEARNFLLDKYGNLEDVKVSIQSWT